MIDRDSISLRYAAASTALTLFNECGPRHFRPVTVDQTLPTGTNCPLRSVMEPNLHQSKLIRAAIELLCQASRDCESIQSRIKLARVPSSAHSGRLAVTPDTLGLGCDDFTELADQVVRKPIEFEFEALASRHLRSW
ncbi:MAG: hypothetical protein ACE361_01145 [Aureliella sp.]